MQFKGTRKEQITSAIVDNIDLLIYRVGLSSDREKKSSTFFFGLYPAQPDPTIKLDFLARA